MAPTVWELMIFTMIIFQSVVSVRVMALNVWGMPAKVGSEDKELRIKVIFIYVHSMLAGERGFDNC